MLGGSWVVTSGVIFKVTIVVTHIRGLITPLITTHEPPSAICFDPVHCRETLEARVVGVVSTWSL